MSADPGRVRSEVEGGVAVVTLERPERLNALTVPLMDELEATLLRLDREDGVRVVIVTGSGRGFCAGLDLQTGFAAPEQEVSGAIVGGIEAQERVANALTTPRRMELPVIAAVNGPAAGGGLALALACDIRLAAEDSVFNAAFVRVGLSGCDCGVSYLLPRIVGTGLAFEMMLSGRRVGSEEALSRGLVSRLVPGPELLATARAAAEEIIANSPFGVKMTKQVMWANLDASGLGDAIELENRTQILCTATEDHREALAAFVERRAPNFSGR